MKLLVGSMWVSKGFTQTRFISKFTSISGILPLDFTFSGLCDIIDINEQYLGSTTHEHHTKQNISFIALVVKTFEYVMSKFLCIMLCL